MKYRFSCGVALLLASGCSATVVDSQSARQREVDASAGGSPASDAGSQSAAGTENGSGGLIGFGGFPSGGVAGSSGIGAGGQSSVDAAAPACDYDGAPSHDGLFDWARVDMNFICGREAGCPKAARERLTGYVCGPADSPPPAVPTLYGFYTHRSVGCGFETISWNGGYGGWTYTFSIATGELVGAKVTSDTNSGPCHTFGLVAGVTADCKDARQYACADIKDLTGDAGAFDECTPEREQTLRALPERPDCDCTIPPGVDPCFARDSCGCWCTQLEQLKEKCPGVR